VVADNCALIANATFGGQFGPPSGIILLLGTYAFAWQIYGDFSGYSDIARGSAQLLGFHFMLNFKQPYLATSLKDFWRRWHISLSTWLRDYLYIPLGGSRRGSLKTYRNLALTMLLGGLWHGANWTFVIWGLHGTRYWPFRSRDALLMLSKVTIPQQTKLSDGSLWLA
jgi:alginate O-acetyltransferase complex protein AlgI